MASQVLEFVESATLMTTRKVQQSAMRSGAMCIGDTREALVIRPAAAVSSQVGIPFQAHVFGAAVT